MNKQNGSPYLLSKAIFFDRDGVVNHAKIFKGKPFPPKNVNELKFHKGIISFSKYLKAKNFKTFIITNQPDISRKKILKKDVENIHKKILSKLYIDEIKICFHDNVDNCSCRKPKIGMITTLKKKYKLNLKKSFVIGDRWRDIECGFRAGCKSIFIDRQYNERISKNYDYKFKSIQQLAKNFYEKKIKH